MIAVRVESWQAWAPGLDNEDAWRTWAHTPRIVADDDEQPACLALPAMQRRRLSRLARMVMEVASPLCGPDEQLPFVFGSHHGESSRTYALLNEVAKGQPLSPTQFGLSVHNAIAGQWSILRGQTGESVAIAGENDTFEHAALEAAALLADGASQVLLVVGEERPPAAYADWISDVPFSYALALRLGRTDASGTVPVGKDWQLTLHRDALGHAACPWPHGLNFLRALLLDQPSVEHAWKTRRWTWQRLR